MSRVAKQPIEVPKGVEVTIDGQTVRAKGPKGQHEISLPATITLRREEDSTLGVSTTSDTKGAVALAGTMRSLVANLVTGVNDGFERKLELRGVGYRAQAQGQKLNLTLGFSHPVVHDVPAGVTVTTPTQTEVIVTGIDKQAVGQVAANIRAYRPPEPYKGKGVRYAGEHVVMKEAKKK